MPIIANQRLPIKSANHISCCVLERNLTQTSPVFFQIRGVCMLGKGRVKYVRLLALFPYLYKDALSSLCFTVMLHL
uniref:Uncharacterized protein n=1 Tax=Anguilla anguilla TaxID=7936 RepID=A0A0E9SHM6_ANGAN